MQRFVQRLTNFLPRTVQKPLGRWSYEACHARLAQKIDLSNEDHCGPCGQYALTKTSVDSKTGSTDDSDGMAEPHTTQLDSGNRKNDARPSLVKSRSMQTPNECETRHRPCSFGRRRMFAQGLDRQSFLVPHSAVQTHASKHSRVRVRG
jgi:hypothetical protein